MQEAAGRLEAQAAQFTAIEAEVERMRRQVTARVKKANDKQAAETKAAMQAAQVGVLRT